MESLHKIGIRKFANNMYRYLGHLPLLVTRWGKPFMVVKRVNAPQDARETEKKPGEPAD